MQNPEVNLIKRPHHYDTYRAQRLIKLGEWVERNEKYLRLIAWDIHREWMEWMEDPESACPYMEAISTSATALIDLQNELRVLNEEIGTFHQHDGSLSITHRFACKEHRTTTLIPAKPKKEPAKDGVDPGADDD